MTAVICLTVTQRAVQRVTSGSVAIETPNVEVVSSENDRSTSSLTATTRFLSTGIHMATEKLQMRTYFRENIDITLTKKQPTGRRDPDPIPGREIKCALPGFPVFLGTRD